MSTTLYGVIAAIPAPVWDGFEIGPLKIHAYALAIILGAAVAFWIGAKRWAQRDGAEGAVFDIGLWAIVFGIVGARLYHVVSSPDVYFGPNYDGTGDPIKIFHIWNGGLGIWGAIAGGAVGAWIAARRYGYKLSAYVDVVAPGILVAQAIGRWGNYFNQELYGAPTNAAWGLEVNPTPFGFTEGTLFHPTFLYEMIWNLIGFAVLILIDRKLHLRRGAMFWSYVAWYTAGRTWIEMLRIDEAQMITILGMTQRLNVWTSLALFFFALLMLMYLGFTRPSTAAGKAEAETVWLPGGKPVAEETTEISEENNLNKPTELEATRDNL